MTENAFINFYLLLITRILYEKDNIVDDGVDD